MREPGDSSCPLVPLAIIPSNFTLEFLSSRRSHNLCGELCRIQGVRKHPVASSGERGQPVTAPGWKGPPAASPGLAGTPGPWRDRTGQQPQASRAHCRSGAMTVPLAVMPSPLQRHLLGGFKTWDTEWRAHGFQLKLSLPAGSTKLEVFVKRVIGASFLFILYNYSRK